MGKAKYGEIPPSNFASVVQVAGTLGITPRRVQQLAKLGILRRRRRGRYVLDDCEARYSLYLDEVYERLGRLSRHYAGFPKIRL